MDRYCTQPGWYFQFLLPQQHELYFTNSGFLRGKTGGRPKKQIAHTFPTQGPTFVGKRRIRKTQGPFFSCEFISAIFDILWQCCGQFKQNLRQNPFPQNPTECWAHAHTCSHSLALCSRSARTLLALCSHSARTRSHSLALRSHSARTLFAFPSRSSDR